GGVAEMDAGDAAVGERRAEGVEEAGAEAAALELGEQVDVQVGGVGGELSVAQAADHALGVGAVVEELGLGVAGVRAGGRAGAGAAGRALGGGAVGGERGRGGAGVRAGGRAGFGVAGAEGGGAVVGPPVGEGGGVGDAEDVAGGAAVVLDDPGEVGGVLDVGEGVDVGHEEVVGVGARGVAAGRGGAEADGGDVVAVGGAVR